MGHGVEKFVTFVELLSSITDKVERIVASTVVDVEIEALLLTVVILKAGATVDRLVALMHLPKS